MLLSIAWIRLNAPDVALAEAAIGAGLTGALLLATWGALPRETAALRNRKKRNRKKKERRGAGYTTGTSRHLLRSLTALLLVLVIGGVGMTLFAGPIHPARSPVDEAALDASGAKNPVTAVLLNFRGYDTLLELAVLAAALAAVWSLGPARRVAKSTPSAVLVALIRVLTPLVPLVCVYLLWAGTTRPGGAFQAGAVLATLAVLRVLSGRPSGPELREAPLRWAAIAGLGVFLAVGCAVMVSGGQFLEYPPTWSKPLMLLIETVAMVSVAATLAGLFIGGRPENRG